MERLSYEQICQLVGRLYLESSAQIERLATRAVEAERLTESAEQRAQEAESQRDDALKLLPAAKPEAKRGGC